MSLHHTIDVILFNNTLCQEFDKKIDTTLKLERLEKAITASLVRPLEADKFLHDMSWKTFKSLLVNYFYNLDLVIFICFIYTFLILRLQTLQLLRENEAIQHALCSSPV